jgi:hypothetical protein
MFISMFNCTIIYGGLSSKKFKNLKKIEKIIKIQELGVKSEEWVKGEN